MPATLWYQNGVDRVKWLWVVAFWMQKIIFSGISSVDHLCSNPHKTPTTQPFSFIFGAIIFLANKNSNPQKNIPDWCSGWSGMNKISVKSGVHAAAYQAWATIFGSLKNKCSGKQKCWAFWCFVWRYQIWWPTRGEHLKNMPILGGVVHLWYFLTYIRRNHASDLLAADWDWTSR
jgi:hypothetical protein